jgi:hypothetical protein
LRLQSAAATVAGHTLDLLNRTVPDSGGVTDIGAFEYGAEQGAEAPDVPDTPAEGTGGTSSDGTGETPATGTEDPGPTGTATGGVASEPVAAPPQATGDSATVTDGATEAGDSPAADPALPAVEQDGGCGCAVLGTSAGGWAGRLGMVLAMGLMLLGRRRRA